MNNEPDTQVTETTTVTEQEVTVPRDRKEEHRTETAPEVVKETTTVTETSE